MHLLGPTSSSSLLVESGLELGISDLPQASGRHLSFLPEKSGTQNSLVVAASPGWHPWIAALPLPCLPGLVPPWIHSLDKGRYSDEGLLPILVGSQPWFVTPTGLELVFPSWHWKCASLPATTGHVIDQFMQSIINYIYCAGP